MQRPQVKETCTPSHKNPTDENNIWTTCSYYLQERLKHKGEDFLQIIVGGWKPQEKSFPHFSEWTIHTCVFSKLVLTIKRGMGVVVPKKRQVVDGGAPSNTRNKPLVDRDDGW